MTSRKTDRVTTAAKRYWIWIPVFSALFGAQTWCVRGIVKDQLEEARKERQATREKEKRVSKEVYDLNESTQDGRLRDLEERVRDLERARQRR